MDLISSVCNCILRYGNGAGNTIENSSIFSLIRMR